MSESKFEYAAFLSYNSADRAIARRLQRSLESYSIPPSLRGQTTAFGLIGERIGKVCRDRTDFRSGESLNTALAEALQKSSALVVLCSPDSAASKWVNAEVEHFKEIGRSARIFPLVARTDETGSILNSYPPALRRDDGDEAIAADLQPTGDGWQDGVLKTLASILDVEYDALRQRALVAARRRARFAFSIAAGMAALSVVAAAAGVVALTQRNRALENFEDAIVISARAASRINQLNDETKVPRALIHRFLTETDNDLQALSSLDAMSRHPRVKRVGVEFELLLSDLYAEVGRSKDQLASSLQAKEWMSSIETDVANPVRRFLDAALFGEVNGEFLADELGGEVAQSLGAAYLSNGRLEGARSEFERCFKSNLAAIDEWDLDDEELAEFQNDALSCAAQQANVLAILNAPTEAISLLQSAIQKLPGGNLPATPFAKIVLAQLYADNSRLSESLTLLNAEIEAHRDGGGRQERIELTELLQTRARALEMTGRLADATFDLDRADRNLDELLGGDANDRRVVLVRGELLTASGDLLARSGRRDEADAMFSRAEVLLRDLVAFDEGRRDWRIALSKLQLARSDNALRIFEQNTSERGALNRAIENARGAMTNIAAVATKDDAITARMQIIAGVSLARALRLGGDTAAARKIISDASLQLEAAQIAQASSPGLNLLAALLADETGDIAAFEGARNDARQHYEEAIRLQRAYLAREPAASIVVRDLVWTELESAKNLIASGDAKAARAQLSSACSLKSSAALSEYSLFVRDSRAVEALAGEIGVRC